MILRYFTKDICSQKSPFISKTFSIPTFLFLTKKINKSIAGIILSHHESREYREFLKSVLGCSYIIFSFFISTSNGHNLLAMFSTACITRTMMDLFSSSRFLMYSNICSMRRSVRDPRSSEYNAAARLFRDFLGLTSSSSRCDLSLSSRSNETFLPRNLNKSLEQSASDVTFSIVNSVARGSRGIATFRVIRFFFAEFLLVCLKTMIN